MSSGRSWFYLTFVSRPDEYITIMPAVIIDLTEQINDTVIDENAELQNIAIDSKDTLGEIIINNNDTLKGVVITTSTEVYPHVIE